MHTPTFLYNAFSSESTILMFFNFAVTSVAAFFMITWLSRPQKQDIQNPYTIVLTKFCAFVIEVLFLPSM